MSTPIGLWTSTDHRTVIVLRYIFVTHWVERDGKEYLNVFGAIEGKTPDVVLEKDDGVLFLRALSLYHEWLEGRDR